MLKKSPSKTSLFLSSRGHSKKEKNNRRAAPVRAIAATLQTANLTGLLPGGAGPDERAASLIAEVALEGEEGVEEEAEEEEEEEPAPLALPLLLPPLLPAPSESELPPLSELPEAEEASESGPSSSSGGAS